MRPATRLSRLATRINLIDGEEPAAGCRTAGCRVRPACRPWWSEAFPIDDLVRQNQVVTLERGIERAGESGGDDQARAGGRR